MSRNFGFGIAWAFNACVCVALVAGSDTHATAFVALASCVVCAGNSACHWIDWARERRMRTNY